MLVLRGGCEVIGVMMDLSQMREEKGRKGVNNPKI